MSLSNHAVRAIQPASWLRRLVIVACALVGLGLLIWWSSLPDPHGPTLPIGAHGISAEPNPVPAGPDLGRTTISWHLSGVLDGQVYVSVEGGPEALLAQGPNGSAEAPWIVAGRLYEFRLYAGTDRRTLAASVQVSRASGGEARFEQFMWPAALLLLLLAIACSSRPFGRMVGVEVFGALPTARSPLGWVTLIATAGRDMLRSVCRVGHALLVLTAVLLYIASWALLLRDPFPTPASFGTLSACFVSAVAAAMMLSLVWRGRLLLALIGSLSILLLLVEALRAGTGPALIVLVWLLLVSLGLGGSALRLLASSTQMSALEWLSLSLLLGFGGLGLLTMGLGLVGGLRPLPVVSALLVLSLPLAWQLSRRRSAIRGAAAEAKLAWSRADLRRPALGLAALALCFWGSLLWALAPAVHTDSRAYHLPVPAADAASGGLAPLPCWVLSHLIGLAHSLYALSFVLGGQPLPGLLSFVFGLIATALTFSLTDRLAGRLPAWVAAVGFASAPVVTWLAGTAYVDLFTAAYFAGGLYALARWQRDDRVRWLVLAGLLGGLALSVKLTALLYLALVALPLAWVCLQRYATPAQALSRLAGFGVPAALAPLPWLARKLLVQDATHLARCPDLVAHNLAVIWAPLGAIERLGELPPVALVGLGLAVAVLPAGAVWLAARRGARWSVWAPRAAWAGLPAALLAAVVAGALLLPRLRSIQGAVDWWGLARPLDLLRLPLDLIVAGRRFPPTISAGPLGLVPSLVLIAPLAWPWRSRSKLVPGLVLALVSTLLWFVLVRDTRYLLPILPLLCAYMALSLTDLGRSIRAQPWLLPGIVGLGGLYLAAALGLGTRWHLELPEAYPYRLALGLESADQFLGRTVESYSSYRYVDSRAEPGEAVITLGSPAYHYIKAPLDTYDDLGSWPVFTRLAGSPNLGRDLSQLGYGWLVINWQVVQTSGLYWPNPVLPVSELRAYSRLQFVDGSYAVYRVEPERVGPPEPGPNLLRNGGFDLVDSGQALTGWLPRGRPVVVNDQSIPRRAGPFVEVTRDDILVQEFPTLPGRLYTLRLAARATSRIALGWLEVRWLDAEQRLLGASRVPYVVGEAWREVEAPAAAPSSAVYGQVEISAGPFGSVWVDDVSLVEE